MSGYYQAFLLARIVIGISFFGHGLVRIPIISKFSNTMMKEFESSIIPQVMVSAFSHALPFAELIIGLLLLIGLCTRYTLIAAILLMAGFIFGATSIQKWDLITIQLFHAAFCIALLAFSERYNCYALDLAIRKRDTK
jgi:thiosulfate dehydrogenase [quinone] large subunit